MEQWESRPKVRLGKISKLWDAPRGTVNKWRKCSAWNKGKAEENVPRGTMGEQTKSATWNDQ